MVSKPINRKTTILTKPPPVAPAEELARKPCCISWGRRLTIPARMIIEIPLPMPRSVINSPIQTRISVPAVSDSRIESVSSQFGPKRLKLFGSRTPTRTKIATCPSACKEASGTVTIRVI